MLLVYLDADHDLWQRRDPSGAPDGDVGTEPPGRGVRAERVIAIVPAARMRTLALALPPVSADKLSRVARFGLEEQLAGDVEAQHVVVAGMRSDKTVVHAIERAWLLERAARLSAQSAGARKIVAESDLVPPSEPGAMTWIWREDGGFVIAPDGRVSILDRGDDALPAGLLLALRHEPPAQLVVRGPPALANEIDAWSGATGVPFALAPAWRWTDADGRTLDDAVDLATADLASPEPVAIPDRVARGWRRAAGWAIAALALHVGASAADWIALSMRTSGIERETRATIAAATPGGQNPQQADLADWRRAYAAARHRLGAAAPDDALPLLADTAVTLAELPPSAVRVIQYEAGQLTLDLEKTAAPALARAAGNWPARGLSVLQAELPGALRLRVTRE